LLGKWATVKDLAKITLKGGKPITESGVFWWLNQSDSGIVFFRVDLVVRGLLFVDVNSYSLYAREHGWEFKESLLSQWFEGEFRKVESREKRG